MTETHATTQSGASMFPAGRYGRRRAARRRPWLPALLSAALLTGLAGMAFSLYGRFGDPDYDALVITYTGITDSTVVIDFRVTLPPGGSAECVLRARSRDGAEVGRDQVRVRAAPGERTVTARHRLATSARPMIGEVLRCRPA